MLFWHEALPNGSADIFQCRTFNAEVFMAIATGQIDNPYRRPDRYDTGKSHPVKRVRQEFDTGAHALFNSEMRLFLADAIKRETDPDIRKFLERFIRDAMKLLMRHGEWKWDRTLSTQDERLG